MTDIIQELRGLIAKGVPESDSGWYISNTTGSGLSIIEDGLMFPGSGICPIKCEAPQAALIVAAVNHLPALLDRLEAAERGMKLMREGIRRANDRVGGIETERMNRDNLSIILCSYFEDADGEQDENGWTLAATEGCDEVLAAIRDHYSAAIDAALVGEVG